MSHEVTQGLKVAQSCKLFGLAGERFIRWLCYGLNACVLQNSCVGILTLKGDDISRWGVWEMLKSWGWRTHEWNQCCIKQRERDLRRDQKPLLACENTVSRCRLWTRNRVLTQPCWHIDLGLPASRIVRNNFLILQVILSRHFVTVAWMDLDRIVSGDDDIHKDYNCVSQFL